MKNDHNLESPLEKLSMKNSLDEINKKPKLDYNSSINYGISSEKPQISKNNPSFLSNSQISDETIHRSDVKSENNIQKEPYNKKK